MTRITTMHRRAFNRNLLMTGLAAPMLLGASAPVLGHVGDGGDGQAHFDRVSLRLPGRRRVIDYFVFLQPDGFHGVDLRVAVPHMAAERIDLGAVPLLGQIFTPPLDRQFADAAHFGSLHLVGRTMVLLPQNGISRLPRHVWITHRDRVYLPPSVIRPLRLKSPPTRHRISAAPRIGGAVLKDGIILAIVPPSALEDMAFS